MAAYLFLLLIPIFFLFLHLKRRRRPNLNLPPSPPALPILGHLHVLGSLPHRSLARLAALHGHLMYLRFGQVPVLIVSTPEAATYVMKTHDLTFSDRSPLVAGTKFTYGNLDIALAPYGDHWKQLRKISTVELLSQKKVSSFRHIRREEVDLLMTQISHLSTFGLVNVSEVCFSFICNVLCREVFGKRVSGYQKLIMEAMDLISGLCFGDFFPSFKWVSVFTGMEAKFNRCFHGMDALLEKELEESSLDDDDDDDGNNREICFVRTLLRLKRGPHLGFHLTREHIKAVLVDMFLGGTDTSAVALEWAMAELMCNPSMLRKAQFEAREVAGGKGVVEESDLEKLGYLKMVVKETLRLHPPAAMPVPRQTRESCVIDGYDVPAGTRVFVNVWAIGRDGRHWEAPEEFRPERFAGAEMDYGVQSMRYLPFGGGRRICPGIALAVTTVELCLANLLLRFEWRLPEGKLDMEEVAGLSIRRKTPLLLRAIPVV